MIRVLTELMTKLSWPRAKAHQQMTKATQYDRYARSYPMLSRQNWTNAKLKRQINALTQRIENGKGWIEQIPTSDPRWPRWQRKLLQLINQRSLLRAEYQGPQAKKHH
jgi:hypothetical protein